jgi:hypothetical protein
MEALCIPFQHGTKGYIVGQYDTLNLVPPKGDIVALGAAQPIDLPPMMYSIYNWHSTMRGDTLINTLDTSVQKRFLVCICMPVTLALPTSTTIRFDHVCTSLYLPHHAKTDY